MNVDIYHIVTYTYNPEFAQTDSMLINVGMWDSNLQRFVEEDSSNTLFVVPKGDSKVDFYKELRTQYERALSYAHHNNYGYVSIDQCKLKFIDTLTSAALDDLIKNAQE